MTDFFSTFSVSVYARNACNPRHCRITFSDALADAIAMDILAWIDRELLWGKISYL